MDRNFKSGLDNRGGQTGLTPIEESSPDLPVPLHPDRLPVEPTSDPIEAVESFANAIATAIDREDYGDWMRVANTYLEHLKEALVGCPQTYGLLWQLQALVQFNPNWHPIETTREAVRLAFALREALGASHSRGLNDYGLSMTETEIPGRV